jgi:hypothetical protein
LIGNILSARLFHAITRQSSESPCTSVSFTKNGILVGRILDELARFKLYQNVNFVCLKNVNCDILNMTKK